MDDSQSVKAARLILRQIQAHMTEAHRNLGAQVEEMGLVSVFHHPESTVPHLNYVAPRRNTAWIPGPPITKGLQRLETLERVPRMYLIEGLYPPLFAKSLHQIGLSVERELALMVYQPGTVRLQQKTPDGVRAVVVDDQEGIALWWYVWRNARYDVVTNGVEPVYIGRDMRALALGYQADLILYRSSFPIGVARLTLTEQTANITAVAVLKEARTLENVQVLYARALDTAIKHGCSLVFTSGETEFERRVCRKLGFVDAGSVIWYAQVRNGDHRADHDDQVEQPSFILR